MVSVILPTVQVRNEGVPAYIQEIVPIDLGGSFPALVVLRRCEFGLPLSPIQVLTHREGQYIDTTSTTFIGSAGSVSAATSCVVADFNGRPGIFIADHGLDKDPFPGHHNTLILATADGRLINATGQVPQEQDFSHDVSASVIDENGNLAIFINNLDEYPQRSQLLMSDGSGNFTDISDQLPVALRGNAPTRYTSSAMIDVTGDGLADLVLGTMDGMIGPSVVYRNPGNGDFSKVMPIALPPSPLPVSKGLYSPEPSGPLVLAIKPIYLPGSALPGLVVASATGDYTVGAVQILANDGKGYFADESALRFDAPITGTGGWFRHILIDDLTGNGAPDIITQSSLGQINAPSQIFLNDGNGQFTLGKTIANGSVYNVTTINGQKTLIVCDGENIILELVNLSSPEPGVSIGQPARETGWSPHQKRMFQSSRPV